MALAFKVEEQHQRLRLVLRCSRDVRRCAAGGEEAPLDAAALLALHQRVLDTERCLLYTLEFDVGVVHPYRFIQATLVAWKEAGVFEGVGWARAARNSSAPREIRAANILARNLAFQLLATGLPLRYTPPELAAAALTLALDVVFAGGGAGGGAPGGLAAALAAAPPASPVRAEHLPLCVGLDGAAGVRAVWELREEAPGALAPYAMGDSAVRASLGLSGGVAPVPAVAAADGGGYGALTPRALPPVSAGRGGGGGGGGGGGAPALAAVAAAPAGPPPAEEMEDGLAPQLAPASPEAT